MDPITISALIGGGAALASSAASATSAALSNRNQYKWSKKFYDYQNEYNMQHYSPAANMERLRLAGINPHEVAGTPGSGLSAQGKMDVPAYQSPMAGVAENMQNAVQMALNAYQIKKNTDNNTDLIQSQINKNVAETAKTNYQVQNLMPIEMEYAKNRQKIPLYQIGTMKLQQQKLLNEISMFSMQKQKFQLGLDLLQLEKEYQEEYYRQRNRSVKAQADNYEHQAGISGLDLKNYQDFGLRPQDPYYLRIGANIIDSLEGGDTWLGSKFKKWFHKNK